MPQVWIEIEENDNCGYFPMLVFESRGEERVAASVVVDQGGPHEVVGWEDGAPCEVHIVPIGDSGAGQSTLIYGGNNGVRLRPADSGSPWNLERSDQFGEPYLSLESNAELRLVQ